MLRGDTNTILYTVDETSKDMELYDILRQYLFMSSRLIRRCKKDRGITVNGRKRSMNGVCTRGEEIKVYMKPEPNIFEPENKGIEIVYEDMDILVIDKPSGMVVHPTRKHRDGTIGNAIAHYAQEQGETYKIRFVNRLDRDTTGLLIVAKNAFAQQFISDKMQLNEVEKTYMAIVEGHVEKDHGTIDAPIGRLQEEDIVRVVTPTGKSSVTHYEVVERFSEATLVKIRLETGRTHQIRVHMKHLGHVLIGDALYGSSRLDLIGRQALQAVGLAFETPRKGWIELSKELPSDMQAVIEKLRMN